nr:tRNA adenosine(34) deaminase TadA [Marinospirillum celere]
MRKPEYYMHRALELATEAGAAGEVPVGALVVDSQGEIIGKGRNACISECDASAHAEVQAIREAGKRLGNYRLTGCDLYVTLEPCTQCVGTLINARIRKVFYGVKEPRTGALASVCNLAAQPWYNHQLEVQGGLLKKQCRELLEDFFKQRRSL